MQCRVEVRGEGGERKVPTQATAGRTSTGSNGPAGSSGYRREGSTRCTGVVGEVPSASARTALTCMSLRNSQGYPSSWTA